jgi:trehalose synthase
VLLDDPRDLEAYGKAVLSLLEDPERAERIGHEACERVRGQFLGSHSLLEYLALLQGVLEGDREATAAD